MAKRQTRVLSAGCAFFACLLMPVTGYAQSTFGDIRGTARDPGGLAVPQAEVILHSLDENTTRNTASDNSGGYLFENVKPGRYEISTTKEGFAKSPTIAIDLVARQSARVDVALSLEQVQQTVSVEAAAAQINTENPVLDDPLALAMLIDVFSERGYHAVVDIRRVDVPVCVDLSTGAIRTNMKKIYRIQIHFQGSEIRRG